MNSCLADRRSESERRDCLYFDAIMLIRQCTDDDECVRGVSLIGKQPGKFALPVLFEARDVCAVDQVSRELHNIGEAGTSARECCADTPINSVTLPVEFVEPG